ncbi:BamA/TamA family outer membrane protein [bacterium]|nr:BamA/TamA family outer membrane protein [bacterium]
MSFPRHASGRLCRALLLLCGLVLLGVGRAAAVSELDFGLEQHQVFRILIEGNRAFDDGELRSLLKIREPRRFHPLMLLGLSDRTARYQPHLLEVELGVLARWYRQRGYHDVRVELLTVTEDPEGRGDVIRIGVTEGPRTDLVEVSFPGAEGLVDLGLREQLRYRPGVPAPGDLNDLGPDLYRLRTGLWERGHLGVTTDPELRPAAPPESLHLGAALAYHVRPGPRYVVGDVTIVGAERTRPELIRKRLQVKPGAFFRWSAVEDSRDRLVETSLFRDVSFRPTRMDSLLGLADLEVMVVERKPAYYEFGFGVGSRERIRVLAGWGHNNLFGTGQKLGLRARNALNYEDVQRLSDGAADPELNYHYELNHNYPDLLGRFGLDTNFYIEKETRGESGLNLRTRGFRTGTRFRPGDHTVNTLAFGVERVEPEIHPDAIEEMQNRWRAAGLTAASTRSLSWNVYDEERDDPVRPRRGSLRTGLAEVAGGPLGGDNSFWKLSSSWHGYTGTPLGGVLAVRLSAGVVRPYAGSLDRGADGVPYQERYFAGGVSSVRGYEERSLGPQITDPALLDSLQLSSDVPLPDQPARGGNYLLLSNVEWRFPVPVLSAWNVGGVFFLDGGNVWERLRDVSLEDFRLTSDPGDPEDDASTKLTDYRWSLGTGVRVDTPVGPVRVDVGFPLKRARTSETDADSRVVYHFSLGYPF